jgi:hypothetical protein
MADGSTKEIKNIQLGDQTKGGEVTGVFQFKASDEIHDYKGVTVAGSHYVKEDGRFIMVKDSPISVKIDKIPVVYSLDTGGQGGSYSTGESGVQSDGSYNDPFDPGGGEKDGGFIDGTNRRMDFMMGGLADLVDIYD